MHSTTGNKLVLRQYYSHVTYISLFFKHYSFQFYAHDIINM